MGYSYYIIIQGHDKDGKLTELYNKGGNRSYSCMVPHYLFNFGSCKIYADHKEPFDYYYEFSFDVVESEYIKNCPKEFDENVILKILKCNTIKTDKFHQIKAYIDNLSREPIDEYDFEILDKFYKKCTEFKNDGFTNIKFVCGVKP